MSFDLIGGVVVFFAFRFPFLPQGPPIFLFGRFHYHRLPLGSSLRFFAWLDDQTCREAPETLNFDPKVGGVRDIDPLEDISRLNGLFWGSHGIRAQSLRNIRIAAIPSRRFRYYVAVLCIPVEGRALCAQTPPEVSHSWPEFIAELDRGKIA